MSGLVDTTEMYLKSILELIEEGVVPLRARIAERLGHSGPTVSQTVARMERDGLLRVLPDRRLELTDEGRTLALRVLRKHRLVERLLTDVVGLDWRLAHDEACRWEHVVSDDVEERLVGLVGETGLDPYGNPVPGLAEIGGRTPDVPTDAVAVADLAGAAGPVRVEVVRLGEMLQADPGVLAELEAAGVRPGRTLTVTEEGTDGAAEVTLRAEDTDGVAAPAGVTLGAEPARYLHVRRV